MTSPPDPARLVFRLLLAAAAGVSLLHRCGSAEFDVTVEHMPQELIVENLWPSAAPTVYVVGLPDRRTTPARLTAGLSLNGVRLTETLLSESVLILYPDGSGKWGYRAGFDIFREPDFRDGRRIDPRTLVEYDKWKYDPLAPVSVVGGDMTLLRLFNQRPLPPLRYEIAFPETISIRTLRMSTNSDQLSQPDTRVYARIYTDRDQKELIAEHIRGGEYGRSPVVFESINRSRVVLELAASAPEDKTVCLYWTFLEAELDATKLQLPQLVNGPNTIRIDDDPESSHKARLVLRWDEKPEAASIWDDFETASGWHGARPVAGGRRDGLAFTGKGFARISFPAVGQNHTIVRRLHQPLDLTGFDRVGIATRVRQGAPMVAILLGIQNGTQSRFHYLRLRPQERWHFQTLDISSVNRDQVTALNLHFAAIHGYNKPEVTCEYDVDSLCFFTEEPQPAASAAPLPDRVRSHQSPPTAVEASVPPKCPPVQEWFPMGVYDGVLSRPDAEVVFLLDEMKRLHMNTIYVSNGQPAGLARVLPLAEKRGIRLIYQGTSAGALYFLHYPTSQHRLEVLRKDILPSAERWVPQFRDHWGLIAWSLTEEISPEMSRELGPYYELVRRLDPEHPPTVLHNNLAAATADLESNRPLVITHDFYPFFWSPRSGPSTPPRSISMYRSRVASLYRACREHGASLWMMPQAWGSAVTAPLDPPKYGYRTGMRQPAPGEIRQQGWLAVAEGATGIMFYATVARSPDQHQLWDYGWTETENTRAAGELFREMSEVAPLLCRLERDYREDALVEVRQGKCIAHTFVKRPTYAPGGRYVVLASLDGFTEQEVTLGLLSPEPVFDMLASRRLASTDEVNIHLDAGGGAVLLVGAQETFDADCRLTRHAGEP